MSVAGQPLHRSAGGISLRAAARGCAHRARNWRLALRHQRCRIRALGDRCSFDAIVRAHDIHDAALDHLATIVRGADTSRPGLTPQGEGLLAISQGLSRNFPDDHTMLKHGLIIYDALYRWCRMQIEKSASPAKMTA